MRLRASLGKVVHTVKRAGTYVVKVPPQELHKIAVHAVTEERKSSTGGAEDYILRQKDCRIYFNWEENYAE